MTSERHTYRILTFDNSWSQTESQSDLSRFWFFIKQCFDWRQENRDFRPGTCRKVGLKSATPPWVKNVFWEFSGKKCAIRAGYMLVTYST